MRYIYGIVFLFLFGINNNSFSQSNGFEVIKNLELIDLIYMNLDKYYVDEPKTGEISKAAIDAMLQELDPYTVYYHESNIEDYRLMTTGQYGGIGALIRKSGEYVFIAEPYENMPAQKAGLKAGDKIISIDGRTMKSVASDVVSDALKGSKGSSFMLEYERPNQGVKKIKVDRDEIKVPDVPYFGMVDDKGKIGYIKLSSFTQTASKNVKSAFEDLSSQGMEKIILDLRGNGGGLLIESIDIVNFFVAQNEEIVKTKGRISDENRSYKTRNNPLDLEIPIVVLVDGFSASASEIVSGSLQDLDRGVIIGSTTFGKGLVQRTIDLKYGAKMKLTIAKYYTPSGRCVQKLDYYHKNDGKVDEIPDSLIKIFHTKNGREVIDGRGIEPDISIEEENLARITAVLMVENIVFDFATEFAQNNPEIAPAKEFRITDKIYKDFKGYVLKKEFEYKTATQEYLERVLEAAKHEGYDKKIDGEFKALQKVVSASKEDDLDLFESQIKELLSNEIVSRYYYQEGRVLNAFQDDQPLKKAIEVLNNKSEYESLLKP
ncbi:S41 family peptidase [Brumimicrobium glaciale]|uniref:S41 family peptidase n=1 Tax=Brumimicrobium glaciale TaxID=200475 RepID=A0A4Q4KME3_9FLAO|nr:S41 family peptidase [Brumimicrobium glaciale]RYM33927.1 S41 family peptidase [Brumimicrobium glaciale]